MSADPRDDRIMHALLVLEILRDQVETTDDEHGIVAAAHTVIQDYRDDVAHLL